MAIRIGGRVVNVPGVESGAVEIEALRSRRSAAFRRADGAVQFVCSGWPMHRPRVGGGWDEADSRFFVAGDLWRAIGADYICETAQTASSVELIRLRRRDPQTGEPAGQHLLLALLDAHWWQRGTGNTAMISPAANVAGTRSERGAAALVRSGRLVWDQALGPGTSLELLALPERVSKRLHVAQRPLPPQALRTADTWLAIRWRFTTTLSVFVDGQEWFAGGPVQVSERVELRDGAGTRMFGWRRPVAIDADGREATAEMVLRLGPGNSTEVLLGFPWPMVRDASYPIVLDPDTITAETDDAHILGQSGTYATARSTSSSFSSAGTTNYCGQNFAFGNHLTYRCFYPFDRSGIPDHYVIVDATLGLCVTSDSSATDFNVRICQTPWTVPIDAGNREANYDLALGSTLDVIWRNTAGLTTNVIIQSPFLDVAYIQAAAGGLVRYSLNSDRDEAGTAPSGAEYVQFASADHSDPDKRPILVVTAVDPTPRKVLADQRRRRL